MPSWAISLFNPDRNHVAARSHAARRDRDQISPATLRRWRCLGSSPARLPARRHTRPAGPRAQRWCRASAGHGCDGRLDDGCSRRTRRAVASLAFGIRHGSITNRLTGHGFHSEAFVTKRRSDGYRAGNRLVPIGLAARHHALAWPSSQSQAIGWNLGQSRPRDPRHFVGQSNRNEFAGLVLQQLQQPFRGQFDG
jgi:hypothetical protein